MKRPGCTYTSACAVKSVVTGIVYSWVAATGVGNPLPACFPELLSHIRSAIIMMPLLAGKALYHFTLSMWLPAQTVYRLVASSSLGQLCVGEKLHPSLLIALLDRVLPHLPLIVSNLMRVLVHGNTELCCLQWQTMHNQHSTLELHINEP